MGWNGDEKYVDRGRMLRLNNNVPELIRELLEMNREKLARLRRVMKQSHRRPGAC